MFVFFGFRLQNYKAFLGQAKHRMPLFVHKSHMARHRHPRLKKPTA